MAGNQDPEQDKAPHSPATRRDRCRRCALPVLLASGASGIPDALEWEELAADDHELTVLPVDDKDLVKCARAHVSAAVADLFSETTSRPAPAPGVSTARPGAGALTLHRPVSGGDHGARSGE